MSKPLPLFCFLLLLLSGCSDRGTRESAAAQPSGASVQAPGISAQQESIAFTDFVDELLLRHTKDFASLAELRAFVPQGYLLDKYSAGDMNKDGLRDYIIVLRPKEKTEEDLPAPLLLCLRQKDNTLKAAAQNKTLPSHRLSFMWLEADSAGGGFSTGFMFSGMGRHAIVTDITARFLYDGNTGQWFLDSICTFQETLGGRPLYDEYGNLVLDEDGNEIEDTTAYEEPPILSLPDGRECTSYKTQKDFGLISFARFNFGHFYDEHEPLVK